MPLSPSQPEASVVRKRRSYTAVACEKCQQRKIKCSGDRPCERCRNGGMTCSYPRTTRFRTTWRTSPNNATAAPPLTDATVPQSETSDVQNSTAESRRLSSSVPESFDYYIRLAESRFAAKSPEQNARPQTRPQAAVIGPQRLQEVIDSRKSDTTDGSVLKLFQMETWVETLHTYHEEVGMQYPFLDIEALVRRIRNARENKHQEDKRVGDICCLIISIVSRLTSLDMADIASHLVHEIFSAAITRVHTESVDKDDLGLLILASMFFFLNDQEVEAWRCIGTVVRLLHELCSLDSEKATVPDTLYWTAYTLDRRWSFGTGLPVAVSDAEIANTGQPTLSDVRSLSSAYLKQMVAYCGISSEVRKAILDQPAAAQQHSLSHDSAHSFAHFRVVQWQKNLPKRLRFGGVGDKYDPARESRGEYKLRLMLYLRANQMRIILLRKAAAVAASADPIIMDDLSNTDTMTVAQDTIRVLVYLGRETDIYHAQHRTFNHFLETALSSLLLIICNAGPSSTTPTCLGDVVAAMDLIRQLSQQSRITKRLHEKLRSIQQTVNVLKTRTPDSEMPPTAPTETGPATEIGPATAADGTGSTSQELSASAPPPPTWPPSSDLQNEQEATGHAAAPSYQGLGPCPQPAADMTISPLEPSDFTSPYDISSNFTMAGAAMPAESYMFADITESGLRELSDILMDYDNFGF